MNAEIISIGTELLLGEIVDTNTTHIADYSMIWHGIGIVRGIAKGRPDQVIVLAALLAAESLIVNQGIKRLFRRRRPTTTGDDRLQVRRPSTSSFPSGHSSSAVFAAMLLAGWDGPPLSRLWFTIAAVVGISRAYVRIHHPSDVAHHRARLHRAERDDLRHVLAPVFVCDVLDHFGASPFAEVDINVRKANAFRVQKPFEVQVKVQRVYVRDSHTERDQTAGG